MESEEEGAGDASGALFASTLPSECWAHIFSFLNGPALARIAEVCKEWHFLATLPSLWRDLCVRSLYPFLSTDPADFRTVGSTITIPRRLARWRDPAAVRTEPTEQRHHVHAFQEMLAQLSLDDRRGLLPEAMTLFESVESLRHMLMHTAPFNDFAVDRGESINWRTLYIHRTIGPGKQAIDRVYRWFFHAMAESLDEDVQAAGDSSTIDDHAEGDAAHTQLADLSDAAALARPDEAEVDEDVAGIYVAPPVMSDSPSPVVSSGESIALYEALQPVSEDTEAISDKQEDIFFWRMSGLGGYLPPEIGLVSTHFLKLPRNDLTVFPRAITANCHDLSLSINRLDSFPLFELPLQLETIKLCHNQLTASSFPAIEPPAINRFLDQADPMIPMEELTRPLPVVPRYSFPLKGEPRKVYPYMMNSLHLKDNQIEGCLPSSLLLFFNLSLLNLAQNRLSSFPQILDGDESTDASDVSDVQRSDEPSLDELPEHAQGLIKTEIDQADDDELTALGLNRLTRRLYRHWTEKLTYLWLNLNSLPTLPAPVMLFTNLIELDLGSNQLTSLPPAISRLQELVWLSLTANKLERLPDELGQLTNLSTLDLSWNRLTALPDTISRLSNLVLCDFNCWRNPLLRSMANVADSMASLTSLTQLNLHTCGLVELPHNLTLLTNLTYLELGSNKLSEIDPNLFVQLTKLESLWLYNNAIQARIDAVQLARTVLPPEIGHLQSLTELLASSNKLRQLPKEIGELTNLTTLDFSRNILSSLPDEMGELTQVRELVLHKNRLRQIPPFMTRLVSLERLDLDNNRISCLPEGMSNLSNLVLLDVNRNRITQPSGLLPACSLPSLQAFFVGMNDLTALPDEIGQLAQLESLNLIENQLIALPLSLSRLTKLNYLYVCYNQLTSVPNELSVLTNLRSLDLSHNVLTDMFDLSALTGLEVFSVYKNQLTSVPRGLQHLTKLKRVWLGINALHTEPPAATPSEAGAASATKSIDDVAEIRSLRVLNMRGNDIHSLPETLSQLTNLNVLSLWRNNLTGPRAIPSSIWLGLTNLVHLHLGENNLQEIPRSIALLTGLMQLGFDKNNIAEVPDELGALTNLRILHLERNSISSLPATLQQLTQLAYLNLSSNRFEGQLPPVLLTITSLTTLDVGCNGFTRLSDATSSFGQLVKLRVLNAGNNRLEELPEELWSLPRVRCVQLKGNSQLLPWIRAREGNELKDLDRTTAAAATVDKRDRTESLDSEGASESASSADVAEADRQSATHIDTEPRATATTAVERGGLAIAEEETMEVMQGWVRRKKRRTKDWWAIARKNLCKSVKPPLQTQ